MVKIRLARGGAKKKPFYSIVATDSRKRRDSGYIERLGYFNPIARGQEVRLTIEEERVEYWRSKGAQISDRVQQLIKEFKDPSIREKRVAAQQAKAATMAAKLAAEAKAKADEEAKAEAEAAAEAKVAAEAKAAEEKAAAETAEEEVTETAETAEAEATPEEQTKEETTE
ncbi:SSU ribosomal protein S16p [uncultured Candidatus Thioglobus sp.]|nr:SSU ribosomal protein S16p [uncultured Candidatus Thioglobus sp.]